MSSTAFRRVSREDVINNARQGGSGWQAELRLPAGVRIWEPTKAQTYNLDFLPYVVKTANHPDRAQPGYLWYKYPFRIHRNVGSAQDRHICPGTIGLPCPICEERKRLVESNASKDAIKALNAQFCMAFNLMDPDNAGRIAVYADSAGKFWNARAGKGGLKNELDIKENEPHVFFYEINEDGRTLAVRYTEEVFEKSKFLEAGKIDFRPRKPMPADILDKVVCLDEMFNPLPYDVLHAKFYQLDAAGMAASAAKAATAQGATSSPPAQRAAPTAPVSTAPATAAAMGIKNGDRVSIRSGPGAGTFGIVDELDTDGDLVVKGEDGKEYDSEVVNVELAPAPAAAPAAAQAATGGAGESFAVGEWVKDDKGRVGCITEVDEKTEELQLKDNTGEWEADFDDVTKTEAPQAAAPAGDDSYAVGDWIKTDDGQVGKITKVKDNLVKFETADGTKGKVEIDDIDSKIADPTKAPPPPPPAAAAAPATAGTIEVGDNVTDNDGTDGVVLAVDTAKEEVTVQSKDGSKTVIDLDETVLVSKGSGATAPKTKKGKGQAAAPPAAPWVPAKDEKVTWDNGTETGTILKIKGDKAKVHNDDGDDELVPLTDLKKA